MSAPRTNHQNLLSGAIAELISAMSALNMHPEPLPADEVKQDTGYLADSDKWAAHSMEHIGAAIDLIQKAMPVVRAIEDYRLMTGVEMPLRCENGELRKHFTPDEMLKWLREKAVVDVEGRMKRIGERVKASASGE